MSELEFIKNCLKEKKGYLKSGPNLTQEFLYRRSGKLFDFSLIRQAKKEINKESKNKANKNKEVKKEDVEGLVSKINDIAKLLGIEEFNKKNNQTEDKEILKRKRALRGFHVPKISQQEGMHILLGCNHVPFHNKQLHKGIIELIKDYNNGIKGFHLMGDFLDLNPLSSHDKGRFTVIPGLTLNDEYAVGNELLDDFGRVLPNDCWKTYLYGNHENRYNRWMSVMDNAKTPLISPEDGLRLWDRGYNVKTSWDQDFITLGNNFEIFHGIYYSIHNAKAHLDKLRKSCAYVHTHRIQNYREGDMAAFNIGSCADFSSKAFNYATRPMKQQWANGFAVNMIDSKGVSHVTQVVADRDGHFYFGGKKY